MTDSASASAGPPAIPRRDPPDPGAKPRLVLDALRSHGPQRNSDLARQFGVSVQSMTQHTRKLEQAGLVVSRDETTGRPGAPAALYSVAPGAAFALGVQLGRRGLSLLALGLDGTILSTRRTQLPYLAPQDVTARAIGLAAEMLAADALPGCLLGIGVALPGHVSADRRHVAAPQSIADWTGFDFAGAFEAAFARPCILENNANAAATGAGYVTAPARRSLYLYVGSGLGAGLPRDAAWRGAHGRAGEIGALPIDSVTAPDGRPIRRLSDLVSMRGLATWLGCSETMLDVEHRLAQGDPELARWIAAACRALGPVLLTVQAFLDIDAISLGGSAPAALRDALRDALERSLAESGAPPQLRPRLELGAPAHEVTPLGAAELPILEYLRGASRSAS